MIHNKFRYLLTLVALFAISTGAWADYTVTWEGATLKSVNVASYGENNKTQTIGDITVTANLGYFKDFGDNGVIASAYEANGLVFSANAKFISVEVTASSSSTFNHTSGSATSHTYTVNPTATSFALPYGDGWIDITKIVFTFENAPEPPIEVTPVAEPAANTKQWTFAMPGSDVVLTPQYAPAAQLDENGAPAAVSGLEIAADAAIITAGQSAQGTLLYAVGTSATEKPALTAFAATLPNAKDLTAAGNYYVWYYIQGHDTPQGQEPTAENTFNDSEIMGPVMVELLTNEHTLNIKQSPNITVTVAGTAKAVTDDKVTPVTTGQEVKIKAKDGYKFRKVEVKKAGPAADIVWDGTNVSDLHVEGNYLSYTKEGIKLSGNAEQVQAEWNNSAYLGTPGMEFITMESGGFTFTAPTGKAFTKIEMKAVGDGGWATENLGTGWAYNTGTVTWTGSAASTVKLLKDADMFSGDFISSIAFYLSE